MKCFNVPFPNDMLPEFGEAEVRLRCDWFGPYFIVLSNEYR